MSPTVIQLSGRAVALVGMAAITYLADKMIDKCDDVGFTVNCPYGFSFTAEGHSSSK